MTGSRPLTAALLASAMALAGIALFAPASVSIAAEKKSDGKPTLSKKVGEPIQAATDLAKQKKFKEALAKLQEADGVSPKTAHEQFVLEETRSYLYLSMGDYPNAIKAIEVVLANPSLGEAEKLKRMQGLAQLNYQVRNYAKAVDYINRYYQGGGTDPDLRALMGQAYFLQGNYKEAAGIFRANIQAMEKAGKTPTEDVLQTLMAVEYKQNNKAAYAEVLERLVSLYPSKEYWGNLLNVVQKKPGFSNRHELEVYRLMFATGTMKTTADYMQMAQLSMQAGLANEALRVLAKGQAEGVLGKAGDGDRQKRLNDLAVKTAADERAALENLAVEAEANGSIAMVKAGESYANFGQHDKGIALIQQAIKAGGLKYPEDVKMRLGVIQIQAGQTNKGLETLRQVKGTDGVADLARFWGYLGRKGAPAN